MTTSRKTPKLSDEEVKRYLDPLLAYRDRHAPDTDTHEYITAQLAKGIVIVSVDVAKSNLTFDHQNKGFVPITAIVAYGNNMLGDKIVTLYVPEWLPNTTIDIENRYQLRFVHGSMRDIWWRPRLHIGRTGINARISNAVKNGRAFKGR
jgi:hypothetical protein